MEEPLTTVVLGTTLVVLTAVSYLLGRAFRRMRQRQHRSEAELAQHRSQRSQKRRELARELHDSIDHDLTIIETRARAASDSSRTGSPAEALSSIKDHAASAAEHLRRVLDLLTREGALSDPTPAEQPDLLGGLEKFRQEIELAGTPVTQEFSGNPQTIAPNIHTVVYKVLQEASTNVIKYAARAVEDPGARCHFRVAIADGHLDLEVTNTIASRPRQNSPALPSGLDGLRERAAAFGATVEAGPSGTEEWTVCVRGLRTH